MTWKEARRRMLSEQQQLESQSQQEFQQLKIRLESKYRPGVMKKFYIWDEEDHALRFKNSKGSCCFWHVIGPPQKDGHDMPALPYQFLLWKMLGECKRIWIKKSRGLGVSEFLLRWLAYNCITGTFPPGSRLCYVVGPRIDLAEDAVSRFKGLFSKVAPHLFDKSSSTVAQINGVKLEAFPSYNTSSMRGLTNVKAIISDESDYYPPFQQKEVRAVMEGYIGKPNSDPWILLVSTPKTPGGLFQQIELEQNSLYYKMFLDYRYGLEGPAPIYTLEHINTARKSPEFGREYELSYNYPSGNVFSYQAIQRAIDLAKKYPLVINKDAPHAMGADPGFGSSRFGVCVLEYSDGIIKVVHAEQIEHASFDAMVYKLLEIKTMVGELTNVFIDSSNTAYVKAAKEELGEDSNWERIHEKILWAKKNRVNIADHMTVVPVSFSSGGGASMLSHSKNLIENEDSLVAIDEKWQDLIVALRGAISENYRLNKSESPFSDLTDSFMLACKFFTLEK